MRLKTVRTLALLLAVFFACGFLGCDDQSPQPAETPEEPRFVEVTMAFRRADYAEFGVLTVEIDGNEYSTGADGLLSQSLPQALFEGDTEIPIICQEMDVFLVHHEYRGDSASFEYLVMPAGERDLQTELIMVGGCVVMHYDGETRLGGGTLFADGNIIMTVDQTGNFGVYVLTGTVLSIEQDGYRFVDVSGDECDYSFVIDDRVVRFRAIKESGS